MVELHNYSKASSVQQKQYNWKTLNRKALFCVSVFLPFHALLLMLFACRESAESWLWLAAGSLVVTDAGWCGVGR